MAAAPLLKTRDQSGHSPRGPELGLACVITLVASAAGCFLCLHLLGALSLLLGQPFITPNRVILASAAGMSLSVFFLHRFGRIEISEVIRSKRTRTFNAVKVVFTFAVVPYAILFVVGLCSFPNGWDALAYHIDTALKWLQMERCA